MKILFQLLAVFPLWLLHGVGNALGWVIWLASPTWRRRFGENARQAGYSPSQVRGAVGASGRLVAELPRLWFGAPVPIAWEGGELIERARASGRGIVFLTPHLGCFEATAQGYAQRFGRITVLFRPARKAWQREVMDSARERPNLATAPTTLAGVKQMIKALRNYKAQTVKGGLGTGGRDEFMKAAQALGIPESKVKFNHHLLGGGFGRQGSERQPAEGHAGKIDAEETLAR